MPTIPLRPETRISRAMSVTVTALMVGLGLAALAGAAALRHVDLEWRHALIDNWTVELGAGNPAQPPSPDEITRLLTLLRTIPGVADARVIEPVEIRALVRPWLGDAATAPDLPLPTLVDVRLVPGQQPAPDAVAQRLTAAFSDVRLDDHRDWTRNLGRLAQTGEMLGLLLLAAIAVTAMVTVAAAARARLAVNRAEIELLHGMGATDRYIVRQFESGALRSAAAGAALGSALAGGGMYLLIRFGDAFAPLAAGLRLTVTDGIALTLVPVGAVFLAIFATRAATMALVRKLP